MIEYLSDAYIIRTLNLLKSDYMIITGFILLVLALIARKTKTKLDDKAIDWLKGKLKK